MSFSARLTLSIAAIVISLALSAIVIVNAVDGGPGWLHIFTYVAGGLLALGIGSLANTIRHPHGMMQEGDTKRL